MVNVCAWPNQRPYLRDVAGAAENDDAPVLYLYRLWQGLCLNSTGNWVKSIAELK